MTFRVSDMDSKAEGRTLLSRQARVNKNYPREKPPGKKIKKTRGVSRPCPKILEPLARYIQYIYPVCPMFSGDDLRRLIKNFVRRPQAIAKHQHPNAQPKVPQQLKRDDAVFLLILAIGELYVYSDQRIDCVTGVRDGFIASNPVYCKEVTQMIESHDGGTELHDAQRLLLAGIHNALEGRGNESAKQFRMADTVLRSLLDENKLLLKGGIDELLSESGVNSESDLNSAFEKLKQRRVAGEEVMADRDKRQIVTAALTCLRFQNNSFFADFRQTTGLRDVKQLLPTIVKFSGESLYDINLPYSSKTGRTDSNKTIHDLHHALTFIEGQLDQIHDEVYGDITHGLSGREIRTIFQAREETVNTWKNTLPSGFRWNEKPSPYSDPMQARLRFMYLEAIRTINQPFLEYASYQYRSNVDGIIPADGGKSLSNVQVRLYGALDGMGEADVMLGCTRCVRAAEQMVILFEEESNRRAITNRCLIADAYVFLQHSMQTRV